MYVAGVFDPASMEASIRKIFGAWESGAPGEKPRVLSTRERQFALLDRAGAPQSTVLMGLRVVDPAHADWIALQVTDGLLGGTFASRITANIREQKGYTYSPFSTVETHPGSGVWIESADVTTNVTGASLKEITFEIERLRKEPPPEAELQGVKNALAGLFVVQNSSRGGVIGQLAFVDLHQLGDGYLSSYVKSLMAVTPVDVQRIANTYLASDKMTIVVVGDTKTVKGQVAPWAKGK